MAITFTGKYTATVAVPSGMKLLAASILRDLIGMRTSASAIESDSENYQVQASSPVSTLKGTQLACTCRIGFHPSLHSFGLCSFRDRKTLLASMRPPFLLRGQFSTVRFSTLAVAVMDPPTSPLHTPHSSNPMCLKVQSDCGNVQASATRRHSFRFAPPPPPRRIWRREMPFPTFPGRRRCCPSSVIHRPCPVFYPFSLRSHAVGSETPGCPQSARFGGRRKARSPIYVPIYDNTTPGEHIGSDSSCIPYRASPAISTRNPYNFPFVRCVGCVHATCCTDYCTPTTAGQSGLGRLVPDDPWARRPLV